MDGILLQQSKDHPHSSTAQVHFGKTITAIEGDLEKQPIVDGKPYDLVIVADGGFSSLRDKYVLNTTRSNNNAQKQQQRPEYAGYVVWRGSVPADSLPNNLLFHIEEGVYKNDIFDTIVLKMAKDNGEDLWTMGSFVATPEEEIASYWSKEVDGASRHGKTAPTTAATESGLSSKVPDWFQQHFAQNFAHVPWLAQLVDHMIREGEVQPHPQYEFAAERVHRGRVILLGDAAHMASPRTAVGAHTAILDALALREALDNNNGQGSSWDDASIDRAIEDYSRGGVERALYARSREVSQQFVPAAGKSQIVSPSIAFGRGSSKFESQFIKPCERQIS